MKLAALATGTCALALLASSPARASVPGNLEERSDDVLLHVCRDVEPGNVNYLVCEDRDPFSGHFTGSECPSIGLPASCVIDMIPFVRLTGRMALIEDDHPLDANADPVSTPHTTLILDLTFDWKTITLIESIDGTKVGNWNPFDESFLADPNQTVVFTNDAQDAFQFSSGTLFELGQRIRDTAQGFFPERDLSDTIPILINIVRDPQRGPVDASAPDDHLGSAAYFRVVVRFARVQP